MDRVNYAVAYITNNYKLACMDIRLTLSIKELLGSFSKFNLHVNSINAHITTQTFWGSVTVSNYKCIRSVAFTVIQDISPSRGEDPHLFHTHVYTFPILTMLANQVTHSILMYQHVFNSSAISSKAITHNVFVNHTHILVYYVKGNIHAMTPLIF